jgi:parallel beta-helix repeat protein
MRKSAALFPIALAAIILAPGAGAREPTPLRKCQTISQPGSYELADNLVATGDCLVITADFVTMDLAGFTITGNFNNIAPGTAILAAPSSGHLQGIAARNGSISNFHVGVDLSSADGSIVEGLRVIRPFVGGIIASGIVKGNTVSDTLLGNGIGATGIVTGNYVTGNRENGIAATGTVTGNTASGNLRMGIVVGEGSTVTGNTAMDNEMVGIVANCPSNLTDNTAINNPERNLILNGDGCNNTNNVAP